MPRHRAFVLSPCASRLVSPSLKASCALIWLLAAGDARAGDADAAVPTAKKSQQVAQLTTDRKAAEAAVPPPTAVAPATKTSEQGHDEPTAEVSTPEGPMEVTVAGDRAPPGSASLSRRELREIPGLQDDPYRAVLVQPGVTPIGPLPYVFIRGAPPGNVGYFFDGIQIPLLFHIGGGPSVIPPGLVRQVDLHFGPYPAKFGRLAGAVIEADSRRPSYTWRGEGAFRVGDLGAFVEGPVGNSFSALVGGRYSIGAALVSALVPSIDVAYGDYQARTSWIISPQSRLTVFAFGAYDYLAGISEEEGRQNKRVFLDSDFHRVDMRYERETDDGSKMLGAVTLGLDRSRGIGVESARDLKLGVRMNLAKPVGRVMVRGGFDIAFDDYKVVPYPDACPSVVEDPSLMPCSAEEADDDELRDAFRAIFPSRLDMALGAWTDAVVPMDERALIIPGLRMDYYRSLGETDVAIDPKLVGRFGVGQHVWLIPAVGIASQLPGFAPLPALQIGGIDGGLQRSLQSSFGTEIDIGPMHFITTLFRQATFNLSDPLGTDRGTSLSSERFLARSLGDGYGLEVSARGPLRRDLFLLVAYTLSRTTRRRDGRVLPSAFDRTHVVHLALLYNLGNNWQAGVRHLFYTGFPADEAGPNRQASEHPDRVRPFYRFDFRVAKRWRLGQRGYLGLILDLQNATLSKEVIDVSCDEQGCTPTVLGPFTIPGLALEGGY